LITRFPRAAQAMNTSLKCFLPKHLIQVSEPEIEPSGDAMRKFGAYPVVVNYNLHTQLRSRFQENDLYRKGRRQEEKQLYIKTTTSSDEVLENHLWKQDVDQYENTICQCLRKIESNPVGRMVLGLINKQTTVWIVPETDDMKKCSCAQTNPLNYEIQPGSVARGEGSGDTVIQFQPELGDDTLFHELVHAYRYSYKKFHPMFINVYDGSTSAIQSTEEFLAHQMENVYMSQANRDLTLDYKWQSVASKEETYNFLVENVEMLMTLKLFLRHEYLAMLVAHTFMNTEYNPFRDYPALEAKYLKDDSLPTLPELGTMLGS
jgi:hypothetical protein